MTGKKGMVSVVLLNWNGKRFITDCLRTLFEQDYRPLELIIIDNASTDASPGDISVFLENTPKPDGDFRVVYKENKANLGFSKAMNQGISMAHGEYILLCNFDIRLNTDFITEAVNAVNEAPDVGGVSGKLLVWHDGGDSNRLIDSTGMFLDYFRTPIDRGQGEADNGQYDTCRDILCPCGALPLYRRTMLEDIKIDKGFFDNTFFAYYEDMDLGLRARLRGWRFLFCAYAVAYHYRGGASKLFGRADRKKVMLAQMEAIKNRYLMMVKNERFTTIVVHLPYLVPYEIIRFFYLLLRFPKCMKSYFRFIMTLPTALKYRRIIQASRTVSNSYMRKYILSRNRALTSGV
ncbi:MAG: glycosyltransferase family 2 protein [Spirochaetales bacterium]|nr:glycosyltransferase family 2 protein [Spirochaetales bacterium]